MGFFNWLFYLICGFFLFIFMILVKNKFKINNFQIIVFSNLFMFIIAGFCSRYGFGKLNINIFLMFVFEMVINIFYSSYVLEKDFFDKEDNNIVLYILLIISGYIFNAYFINRVQYVFLSGEDFKIICWLMMFLFLYQFFKDNKFINNTSNKEFRKIPSDEGIVVSYARLKNKYNEDINYDNKDICNIIYSIMIFENHKRPKILREYDNFRYRFDGGASKLGIMQVKSKKFITDIESIEIVYKKISKLYEKNTVKKKVDINNIIVSYDKENSEDIIKIYEKISKF